MLPSAILEKVLCHCEMDSVLQLCRVTAPKIDDIALPVISPLPKSSSKFLFDLFNRNSASAPVGAGAEAGTARVLSSKGLSTIGQYDKPHYSSQVEVLLD